jgi:hypothetical protein
VLGSSLQVNLGQNSAPQKPIITAASIQSGIDTVKEKLTAAKNWIGGGLAALCATAGLCDPNKARKAAETAQEINRKLTAAEVGLGGQVSSFDASIRVVGDRATVTLDLIVTKSGQIDAFSVLPKLRTIAESYGAKLLRVDGTFANERLMEVMSKRYKIITEGGKDYIEIVLGGK